ncbi:MAG: hypothetical protein ACOY71_11925 [Gemmatimonadota bacterium]
MIQLLKALTGAREAFGPSRLTGLAAMVEEHAQTLRNSPVSFEQWATSDRVSPRQIVELRAMCAHLIATHDALAPVAERIAAHLETAAKARPETKVAASKIRVA